MTITPKSLYFNKARFGLIWALNRTGILSKPTAILLPEFICDSLIDILSKVGCKIIYYKIDDKLNPSIESIEKQLLNNANIKALIYVNYFGLPPQLDLIRVLCKENKLLLIEDNSHGFGGVSKGKNLGEIGDISISSPRKSFTSAVGGVVTINSKVLLQNELNNKLYRQLNYSKIPINTSRYFFNTRLIQSLKNTLRIKRLSFFDQEDPYSFREKSPRDIYIDPISDEYNYFVDWQTIRNSRINGWKLASSLCNKLGLSSIFTDNINQLCPWAYPAFCRDIHERNQLINFFYRNSLAAFSWPCLPNEQISCKSKAFDYWEKLICLPLNDISIESIVRINKTLS